jgi:hypothetical protein
MSKVIKHDIVISLQKLVKDNTENVFLEQENLKTITEVIEKTLNTLLERLKLDNVLIETRYDND